MADSQKARRARAKPIPEERPSFGAELSKLEQIVRALEDESLDLDRAIELFQEGVESLKVARSLLRDAELTVKSVVQAADGSLRAKDVD